jgi:hypothetical protein
LLGNMPMASFSRTGARHGDLFGGEKDHRLSI